MGVEIVFETHALSEDNDRGVATGWLPGRLSKQGMQGARELGRRRREDGIAAVFSSDLGRAVETASIAFEGTTVPILHDWRLRECDYGARNGRSAAEVSLSECGRLHRYHHWRPFDRRNWQAWPCPRDDSA